MPLDQAQGQKLDAWLRAKAPLGLACPVCQRKQWSVGDIVSAPTWSPQGFAIGGPTVPTIQVICNHCAYVMHFAAVPIGLAQ